MYGLKSVKNTVDFIVKSVETHGGKGLGTCHIHDFCKPIYLPSFVLLVSLGASGGSPVLPLWLTFRP